AKQDADYLETRGLKLVVSIETLKRVFTQVTSFQRGTFRQAIEEIHKLLGLTAISDDQRKLFVKCRNSLVHQGQFYCQSAEPQDRTGPVPPLSGKKEEYCWLLHFVDRMFLRLVGYDGPYIDWQTPGQSARRDKVTA